MSSPNLPANTSLFERIRHLQRPPQKSDDKWYEVGDDDAECVFENGWGNVGGGYANFAYHVSDEGKVYLRGAVNGGATSTTITTLPEHARPEYKERFVVPTDSIGVYATIEIQTDGSVVYVG